MVPLFVTVLPEFGTNEKIKNPYTNLFYTEYILNSNWYSPEMSSSTTLREIPEELLQGLIFDCDGTLVDTVILLI